MWRTLKKMKNDHREKNVVNKLLKIISRSKKIMTIVENHRLKSLLKFYPTLRNNFVNKMIWSIALPEYKLKVGKKNWYHTAVNNFNKISNDL